jgi:hypothetical protein
MPCGYTGSAYKGYALQLFLHHPLEVVPEVTVYKEYIECSLMICHEDIRGVFVYVLTPAYLGANKE